ncbi:MAG: hypothetical protein ACXVX8_10120 [Blastococcus sp.]
MIYGLPAPQDQTSAEQGRIGLGGCMMPENPPAFFCRACGLQWGHESDPTTDEQALAEILGVPYPAVVRALGTGWRREGAASEDALTQWFVSGEPAQLAVGVTGPWFVLARPVTDWGARHEQTADMQTFGRDDVLYLPWVVAEAAEVIASRRRRSFRWCRMCRRVHAPESFVGGAGICQRCDSTVAYIHS